MMVYNRGMKTVILYTKLECPLCDKAYNILLNLAIDNPLEIDVIDITHPHNNIDADKYLTRIPVIARADLETELEWPFTLEEVQSYLRQ